LRKRRRRRRKKRRRRREVKGQGKIYFTLKFCTFYPSRAIHHNITLDGLAINVFA
jgi:hypothetical protein